MALTEGSTDKARGEAAAGRREACWTRGARAGGAGGDGAQPARGRPAAAKATVPLSLSRASWIHLQRFPQQVFPTQSWGPRFILNVSLLSLLITLRAWALLGGKGFYLHDAFIARKTWGFCPFVLLKATRLSRIQRWFPLPTPLCAVQTSLGVTGSLGASLSLSCSLPFIDSVSRLISDLAWGAHRSPCIHSVVTEPRRHTVTQPCHSRPSSDAESDPGTRGTGVELQPRTRPS